MPKMCERGVSQAKNAMDFVLSGFKLILDWHKRQMIGMLCPAGQQGFGVHVKPNAGAEPIYPSQ